jgi:NAD kinase
MDIGSPLIFSIKPYIIEPPSKLGMGSILIRAIAKLKLAMKYKKIAVIAANKNAHANERKNALIEKYSFTDITNNHKQIENIDLVIAIGGDGLMLHLLHEYEAKRVPVYGINCGTVGFLMNNFSEEDFSVKEDGTEKSLTRSEGNVKLIFYFSIKKFEFL